MWDETTRLGELDNLVPIKKTKRRNIIISSSNEALEENINWWALWKILFKYFSEKFDSRTAIRKTNERVETMKNIDGKSKRFFVYFTTKDFKPFDALEQTRKWIKNTEQLQGIYLNIFRFYLKEGNSTLEAKEKTETYKEIINDLDDEWKRKLMNAIQKAIENDEIYEKPDSMLLREMVQYLEEIKKLNKNEKKLFMELLEKGSPLKEAYQMIRP